jgi:hypothetical protein
MAPYELLSPLQRVIRFGSAIITHVILPTSNPELGLTGHVSFVALIFLGTMALTSCVFPHQVILNTILQLLVILLVSATLVKAHYHTPVATPAPPPTITFTPSTPSHDVVLAARQQTCPVQCDANHLGEKFAGVCCQSGQICSLDANGDPACCPSGYVFFMPDSRLVWTLWP